MEEATPFYQWKIPQGITQQFVHQTLEESFCQVGELYSMELTLETFKVSRPFLVSQCLEIFAFL